MARKKTLDKNVESRSLVAKEAVQGQEITGLTDGTIENALETLSPSGTGVSKTGKSGKPVSKAAEIKESFFRAFQKAGGLERLVKIIGEKSRGRGAGKGPTKEMLRKADEADRRFLEFCYKVLPQLFPRKTELEVETRSVKFVFAGGKVVRSEEKIRKEPDYVDIEFDKT